MGQDIRIIKGSTLATALISHATLKSQFPPWLTSSLFPAMLVQIAIGPLHRAFIVPEDERGFLFGHSWTAVWVVACSSYLSAILFPVASSY